MTRRLLAVCVAAALLAAVLPMGATATAGTSTLMGRIRNMQGNAVNNVRVLLYHRYGGVQTLVGEARTENGGQFQFLRLFAATYGLKVVDDSGYYASAWYGGDVTLGIGELRQGVDMTVSRAGSISGVVSNSAAVPLSGIIVNAYPRNLDGSFDDVVVASAQTGADGGYTLSGIGAGTYAVQFFSTRPDYASQFYGESSSINGVAPVTLAEAGRAEDISATLRRWGGLSGSVTATGAGMANAIVRCYRRDGTTWTPQSAAVTLTKDPDTVEPGQVVGSFAVDRLYPGTYRVAIEAVGLPTARPVQWYGGASGPSTEIGFAADVEVVEDVVSTGVGVDFTDDDLSPTTTLSSLPGGWPRSVTVTLTAVDSAGGSGVGATYYWFDTGVPTVYTGPFTYGVDGGHTLSWYSVDRFGNREPTRTAAVFVDGLPPVTISDVRSSYTDSARIQFAAADNRTGVAATYYSLDGGPSIAGTSVVTYFLGVHSIRYWSVDGVGNIESMHTNSFMVNSSGGDPTDVADTTPPVTTIVGVPEGWSRADVVLSFVASDNASNIGAVYYRLGGDGAVTYTGPVVVTAEGATSIEYWAVDARYNSETPRSAIVRVDKTPPSSAADVTGYYVDSARISIVASDAVSGLSVIRCSLDGVPSTGTVVNVVVSGSHTLEWAAVDVAGNVEATHAASFTVYSSGGEPTATVDTTPPVTTIIGVPEGWSRSDVEVSFVATDGISDIEAVYYRLGGGAVTAYTGPLVVTTEGTTPIEYWAVDALHNNETPHRVVVRIDRTPPESAANVTGSYVDSARISIVASDAVSGLSATYYSLDGGTATPGNSVVTYSSGVHSLRYWAVDAAGNIESMHAVSFIVNATGGDSTDVADTTPPVTTIIGVPEGWSRSDVEVSFASGDDISNIGAIYYRLGSGAVTTYTAPLAVTTEGTTSIEYWAVDARNNREATRSALVRIDRAPPVSTADVREFYLGSARISIVASDAVSGLSVIRRSLDGVVDTGSVVDVSEAGTHTLAWAAVDVAGNAEATRSASFTVTRRTRMTSSARALRPAYGASARVAGMLADSSGTPLPGRTVHLETYSGGAWIESPTDAVTDANGVWSFSVRPSSTTRYRAAFFGSVGHLPSSATETVVSPKAYLTTPYAPKTVARGRRYTVYGYLRPRHPAGALSVRVQCYRLENRRWVLRRTVWARNADYGSLTTRFAVALALPYAGSWRLRVYHADASHAATYSTYRYALVR